MKLEHIWHSSTVGPGSILHLLIMSQSWGLHNCFCFSSNGIIFPFPSTPLPGFSVPNLFPWSPVSHLLFRFFPLDLKWDRKALGRGVNRVGINYLSPHWDKVSELCYDQALFPGKQASVMEKVPGIINNLAQILPMRRWRSPWNESLGKCRVPLRLDPQEFLTFTLVHVQPSAISENYL